MSKIKATVDIIWVFPYQIHLSQQANRQLLLTYSEDWLYDETLFALSNSGKIPIFTSLSRFAVPYFKYF